jgi:glycosyltransferase involved in cell wall biosynthesis
VLLTSEDERVLARRSFWLYQANELVVDCGIEAPAEDAAASRAAFLAAHPELRDKRVVLFMSRLHRKKGVDLLVEGFAEAARLDARLHLLVVGPDQESLRPLLEARARVLGIAHRITWTGMLSGASRWGAFHVSEVFCLPSHSENFGIAVVEAMARGIPVLISDKVNIWREIDDHRAGFVAPNTVDGTTLLLTHWLHLSEDERGHMSRQARACFTERFEVRAATAKLVTLIERTKSSRTCAAGVLSRH